MKSKKDREKPFLRFNLFQVSVRATRVENKMKRFFPFFRPFALIAPFDTLWSDISVLMVIDSVNSKKKKIIIKHGWLNSRCGPFNLCCVLQQSIE
jgi:hypothetical protein